jgi:hypothetical protein
MKDLEDAKKLEIQQVKDLSNKEQKETGLKHEKAISSLNSKIKELEKEIEKQKKELKEKVQAQEREKSQIWGQVHSREQRVRDEVQKDKDWVGQRDAFQNEKTNKRIQEIEAEMTQALKESQSAHRKKQWSEYNTALQEWFTLRNERNQLLPSPERHKFREEMEEMFKAYRYTWATGNERDRLFLWASEYLTNTALYRHERVNLRLFNKMVNRLLRDIETKKNDQEKLNALDAFFKDNDQKIAPQPNL